MSGKLAWQIFWRTFAQVGLPVLLAAQGYVWATTQDAKVNATTIGLGLLAAFVAAIVAVGIAYAATPAATAAGKAVRSGIEALAGVVGALVFNSVDDVLKVGTLVAGGVATVILAMAVTYFQYQAEPVSEPV
jgi:hypothetical protein